MTEAYFKMYFDKNSDVDWEIQKAIDLFMEFDEDERATALGRGEAPRNEYDYTHCIDEVGEEWVEVTIHRT